MSQHPSAAKKKNIQLIIFGKNYGELTYHQKCRIIIDKVQEKFIITPKKNGAENIETSFSDNFRHQNEFLYSFSFDETFILIFPQKESCKNVFNLIFKHTKNGTHADIFDDEILSKRFIIPFFKAFQTDYNRIGGKLKDILAQILQSLTIKQNGCCLNSIQKSNINKHLIQKYFKNTESAENYRNVQPNVSDESDISDNYYACDSVSEEDDSDNVKNKSFHKNGKEIIHYLSAIIESPNFKVVEFEKRNQKRPILVIFPFKNDKTKSYEYYWSNKKSIYYCCGCALQNKLIRAKIVIQKNGKERSVQLQSKKHVCKIRDYNTEKYDFDPVSLILDETRFKKFEYEKNGKQTKVLVIFDSTDKNLCYEYFWRLTIDVYQCRGCTSKCKQVKAKIIVKNGKEFVQQSYRKHVCELRKFNPKKFEKSQIFEASNFEIVEYNRRGMTRQKLILFPFEGNRSQCYEYSWIESTKIFICNECCKKGKQNSAKIFEKNGKKYVEIIGIFDHICEIREYNSKNYGIEIVKAPNLKIIEIEAAEEEKESSSILFVFCPTNKMLGYEYSWDSRRLCYYCLGCHLHHKRTIATICKDSKGCDYVKIFKALHICDLREYDEEKYQPNFIFKKPDFKIHEQNICGSIKKKLFIYTSKELKLGYKFAYCEARACFHCIKCKNQKHTILARIFTDPNGNEYVSVRNKKHICQPIEYSKDEYESRKIVKAPRYLLIQRNVRNRILERLIVFVENNDNEENNLCYEYTKDPKSYKCNICAHNHKHSVFAKLIKSSSMEEEEYVELGPNEHKCSPVKYEPPEALIVNLPNFKIEKLTKNGSQRKSLIIFSSLKNKRLQYNYYFDTKTQTFVCGKCKKKNKRVTSKLLKNKNGEDYLELNSKHHFCQPH